MTDDDLTTAYILGVEHIRDKMHKQADEIERLRERLAEADECNRRVSNENETLRRDLKTAVMGDSAELQDVKRENEALQEKEKDYLEMLRRQAQTIVKLWKMMGSLDNLEAGK